MLLPNMIAHLVQPLVVVVVVRWICDLMVEDRKTKGSVAVTSSEKADSYGRYFKVRQLPDVGLYAQPL